MYVCRTGSNAATSWPWANHARRLFTAKNVPQVMDAGAVTPPAVRDAGLPQKPAKVVVNVDERERAPRGSGKEPFASPGWVCGGPVVVVGESDTQRLGDRHLPVFAAFRVTDLQHPDGDIDVLDA